MRNIKILILSLFLLILHTAPGQINRDKSSIIDSLIDQISKLQIKSSAFYSKGQFPAQRGKLKREDNNIFFTSLVSFTLKNIDNFLGEGSKEKVDSICRNVKENYSFYQNQSGQITYNFWKTDPPFFFPNSWMLSKISAFHVPDDADCTSLVFMTDTSLDKNLPAMHLKLAKHANLSNLKIKNTFKRYQKYKAYATWFGNKMPIEFDMCVQSNILYLIYLKKLPLTIQDEETLALLQQQIQSGDYLRYSYYLSPSYKKKAIVLYHLARLLENNPVPILESCKTIIKKDIESELKRTKIPMEKIILSTALIRMGGHPERLNFNSSQIDELLNYVFFRANLFSSYARPSLRFISKSNLLDCRFYCKAYALTLLTEYEVLAGQSH